MANSQWTASSAVIPRASVNRFVRTAGTQQRNAPAWGQLPSFQRPFSTLPQDPLTLRFSSLIRGRPSAVSPSSLQSSGDKEEIFFDGGPHIGDLLTNIVFGLTLLWLPLTLASVFRALFLRYRFTNVRVTVMSGLTGSDRKDFSYKVIKDVKYVPRFIGEWGDIVITLTDGTQVELKSVPRFREIAQYCLDRAGKAS
ncbi:hypothetical protein KP509_30G065900 [Ceratopteris richardii]|uniref:YdbS-like PH domain-containing protein n=1 Tax=Ceratopteris richardii TaxID=49495 RepID=A0A8T2R5J3_CERRI|nr:hypothetical protein KP509_30G065900 [Ceratopteris richardii]